MSAETQTAPRAGAHRKPRPSAAKVHGKRITWFSLIGAFVFCMGTALQWMLIRSGAGTTWSYAWQSVFSIELSFVLNRTLTWGDRAVGVFGPLAKWNAQKLALTVPNFAAYALLVHAGLSWLAANLAVTAVFTVLNYIGGDLWSFREHRVSPLHWVMGILWCFLAPVFAVYAVTRSAAIVLLGSPARQAAPAAFTDSQARGIETLAGLSGTQEMERRAGTALPTVSVVIPCKDSQATIRETVFALLNQDYPALEEVILVGSVNDPTWAALAGAAELGFRDPQLVLLEQEQTPGKRDPAVKRDKGLHKACGEVLALVDSDIVMDPGWLSTAIAEMQARDADVVAGGMRSIHDTFWGRFVDRNRLGAKTPRLDEPYFVTAQNFGRRGRKPPITANVVFRREVYDAEPLDTAWSFGYEDYEWFWRIAKARFRIWFSDQLSGRHHHRRSFRLLAREYQRAAGGCAKFVRTHPDSPLARKRRRQAIGIPLALVASLAATVAAALTGNAVDALAGEAVVAAGLAGRELWHSRRLESVAYPVAGTLLGAVFTTSLVGGLICGDRSPGVATKNRGSLSPTWRQRICWPLMAILALQAGLSLSLVWANSAFGDEALYLWAGHVEWAHWLSGGPLPTFSSYFSGAPQLYPALGALADSVGGLAAARVLSLCFMMGTTALLYSSVSRLFTTRTALIAIMLWVTSESVLRMGAFATFDPMAIFLLCLAMWFAINASYHRRHAELVAAAGITLALAAITAYSYLIYMPVMICIAATAWLSPLGKRRAIISAAWLSVMTGLAFLALASALKLWRGIVFVVIFVKHGNSDHTNPLIVAETVWTHAGLLLAVATVGTIVAIARAQFPATRLLLAALLAAGFVVPTYQTFIAQTAWALDKLMTPGLWLAMIGGACGIGAISWPSLTRSVRIVIIGATLACPLFTGWYAAFGTQRGWPEANGLAAAVTPLAKSTRGTLYDPDIPPSVLNYYTRPESLRRITWIGGASLDPRIPQSHLLRYYQSSLNVAHPDLVVVAFPGAVKSAALPGDVISGLQGADARSELLQAAAASTKTPGLYYFALALQDDHEYKIAATGTYNSGFGLASSPNTYVVWQRAKR